MGKGFMKARPGKKDTGPEVVIDNGEDSNKKMKRMLRPVKLVIIGAILAVAAFDSFYILSEMKWQFNHIWEPASVTTSGLKLK